MNNSLSYKVSSLAFQHHLAALARQGSSVEPASLDVKTRQNPESEARWGNQITDWVDIICDGLSVPYRLLARRIDDGNPEREGHRRSLTCQRWKPGVAQ